MRCKAHGGYRECKIHGCYNMRAGKEFCLGHGGAQPECIIEGCSKYPRGRAGLCPSHGGTKFLCSVDGCQSMRQGVGDYV